MKKIGQYIKWYFYITTSILIVTAIIFGIYGDSTLPAMTLWQILLSGLLTTIVTVVHASTECKGTIGTIIKSVCHYIVLCIIMIFCGKWFGWLDFNLPGILMMVLSVAAVYLLTFGAYYLIDLRDANKMNKRLKEKYGEKEI